MSKVQTNIPQPHLGANGFEVRKLLTELPPLPSLKWGQSVMIVIVVFPILSFVEPLVHEDQDGELVGKLLRQKDRMISDSLTYDSP